MLGHREIYYETSHHRRFNFERSYIRIYVLKAFYFAETPTTPPVPRSPTTLTSPFQSPTSITLSWEQPAGGAVDRYDIVYTYQGGCSLQSTSFETTATTEMLTLQSLEEFSGYSVSVTAVNNGGRSAPATRTFTTKPAGKHTGILNFQCGKLSN